MPLSAKIVPSKKFNSDKASLYFFNLVKIIALRSYNSGAIFLLLLLDLMWAKS